MGMHVVFNHRLIISFIISYVSMIKMTRNTHLPTVKPLQEWHSCSTIAYLITWPTYHTCAFLAFMFPALTVIINYCSFLVKTHSTCEGALWTTERIHCWVGAIAFLTLACHYTCLWGKYHSYKYKDYYKRHFKNC